MRIAVLLVSLTALTACAPVEEPTETDAVPDVQRVEPVTVFLPAGNAVDGREAFLAMRCNACHVVPGQNMVSPAAPRTELGPQLDPELASRTRDEIATSIITPSHVIDQSVVEYTEGLVSPMGDYTSAMTIRQLIDIVAFLQSL